MKLKRIITAMLLCAALSMLMACGMGSDTEAPKVEVVFTDENVEDAALHIIPTLYGVPQISMLIKNLNEEHKRMLKFYLDFWKENRETLLDGKLIAYNPETSYSQVKALSDNCEIVTVYDNVVVEVIKPVCKIINSSKLGFVIVKNAMNRNYEIINCMGDLLKTGCISSALEQIDIPLASILIIK